LLNSFLTDHPINSHGDDFMVSIQANLLKIYSQFQHLKSPPTQELDVVKARAEMEALSKLFKPLAELKNTTVEVNGVPGEWITPLQVTNGRVILYLHGGYYMVGSIQSHRNLAGNIAAAAQARALIIDYRLAPEHPFPAALDDALIAYLWLLAQGIRPDQIFLVGDSAGGGLVLAVLLALRERGKPLPAAAICLSPYTDLTGSGESWKFNAKKELVITRFIADQVAPKYLGEIDTHDPLASPLFGDLHDLPPLLIQVGSDEVLLSDSTSFAERARAAGVDVTLEVWPGMQHVWQFTASFVPEARRAIVKIGEFIQGVGHKHPGNNQNPLPLT
jgi:monoterpene epsilon-lactone hydrolase